MTDVVMSPRTQTIQYYEPVPATLQGSRPEPDFGVNIHGLTIKKREQYPLYYVVTPEGYTLDKMLDSQWTDMTHLTNAIANWMIINKAKDATGALRETTKKTTTNKLNKEKNTNGNN